MSKTPIPPDPGHTSRLLSLTASLVPFITPQGEAYVTIRPNTLAATAHHLPVRSPRLRTYLIAGFFANYHESPTPNALRRAIALLEAQAIHSESIAKPVALRFLAAPGALALDLANRALESVSIVPNAWAVTHDPPGPFRRPVTLSALPEPTAPTNSAASIDALSKLLRLPGRRATLTLLAWLVNAFRAAPSPILALTGPPSSGKSRAAALIRSILDPSPSPLHTLPDTHRAFQNAAFSNPILAFDHVHRLSGAQASALAQLSAGGRYALREPGAPETLAHHLTRPVLLALSNPNCLHTHAGLRSHALFLDLPPLHPENSRSASELHAAFERLHPDILGVLCHAASVALANYNPAAAPNEFTAWAAAAAPAFNATPEEMLAALSPSPSPDNLLEQALDSLLPFAGPATELYEKLAPSLPLHARPASAQSLSQTLNRLPNITLTRTQTNRGRTRNLHIQKAVYTSPTFPPTPLTPASIPEAPPPLHPALPDHPDRNERPSPNELKPSRDRKGASAPAQPSTPTPSPAHLPHPPLHPALPDHPDRNERRRNHIPKRDARPHQRPGPLLVLQTTQPEQMPDGNILRVNDMPAKRQVSRQRVAGQGSQEQIHRDVPSLSAAVFTEWLNHRPPEQQPPAQETDMLHQVPPLAPKRQRKQPRHMPGNNRNRPGQPTESGTSD